MNEVTQYNPSDSIPNTDNPNSLRLWPALLIIVVMLAATYGTGLVVPGTMVQFMLLMIGPMVGAGLLAIWWLFASRAPLADRLAGLIVLLLAGLLTHPLAHESMKPLGLLIYGVPAASTTFVIWLWATQHRWSWQWRRCATALVIVVAVGFWTLVRCDGVDGALSADLSWRWSSTNEELYLASLLQDAAQAKIAAGQHNMTADEPLVAGAGDWPGFRGPQRDGKVTGVVIGTDWQVAPPAEIWRQRIGPGWGSFSVIGDLLFTQEQRGTEEAVVCYNATSGKNVWSHTYAARFSEVVAGPGPRATPTFHDGKLYTLGASGILNCLDARTGRQIWSRDMAADAAASPPEWGFASSPLLIEDVVVVFAGGQPKSVIAYDQVSGEPRWTATAGKSSYSSPQYFEAGGVPQILMYSELGLVSLSPIDGHELWRHAWPQEQAARIVQPHVISDDNSHQILLGTGYGVGTRSISVEPEPAEKVGEDGSGEAASRVEWAVIEGWTSRHLKPYFNDFVSHEGHLYGFDGNIVTCVNVETGERRWKRGRYGNGQLLLLADQDLLLIVSEKGDLVLVEANSERHRQLARISAVQGKTWNHPVIAHGKLFVRNGEEVVCFELPNA